MIAEANLAALLDPARLRRIALLWCVIAGGLLTLYLANQLRAGWSDGAGRPFGEDFINFWSGARLSATGRASTIYDLSTFHQFQRSVIGAPIDLYHYSYPPVAWLLTAPFGVLPYPVAWALWQAGGWLAFALALRRIAPDDWLLLALATPALFVNAIAGQNGCWTAAILGWGLIHLPLRPVLAGLILSLFVVKPQLAWAIPVALLAGRYWRATLACAAGAAGLVVASAVLFGIEAWGDYLRQAAMLKTVILEHGSGTWHRMLSVFVLVRHAGASTGLAYAAQGAAAVIVAWAIARVWHREGATHRARAVLALGVLVGSLYVSDYDCVMLALTCAWRWPQAGAGERLALSAAMLVPLAAAPIALASGLALGAVPLWLAFGFAVRQRRSAAR